MDDASRAAGSFTALKPLPSIALPAPPAPAPPATGLVTQAPAEANRAWPRSAQWTTAALLGGVLTLLGVHLWAGSRGGAKPAEHEPGLLLDLNEVTRAELLQLPGIGPGLADRILAYRKSHGPFRRAEDLRKVPGIGPATWRRIRDFVFVDLPTPSEESTREPAARPSRPAAALVASQKGTTKSKKEQALAGQTINVNRASLTDLQKLPGVGPKVSQRIVDERHKRPFATVEELRRVAGIGPKTLEKLRPYVTTEDEAGSNPVK